MNTTCDLCNSTMTTAHKATRKHRENVAHAERAERHAAMMAALKATPATVEVIDAGYQPRINLHVYDVVCSACGPKALGQKSGDANSLRDLHARVHA
jgi:hypothetical protein